MPNELDKVSGRNYIRNSTGLEKIYSIIICPITGRCHKDIGPHGSTYSTNFIVY